jgi:Sugar (and other) transporter
VVHCRYDFPLVHLFLSFPLLMYSREIIYSLALGVTAGALASELGSLPLRSQTQGLIGLTQCGTGWLVVFVVPYIINPDAGDLGGKIGYVFFGFGGVCAILLFFFCPETKGLSYDEVCLIKPLLKVDGLSVFS